MLKLPTIHLIKNNYPENVRIVTHQEGRKYKVNGYLLDKGKPVQHLFTSKPLFDSHGSAKLYAEIQCQSFVDDKMLNEPEKPFLCEN